MFDFNDLKIKSVSSCLRNLSQQELLSYKIKEINDSPQIGDVLICSIKNLNGYDVIEDISGYEIKLCINDIIIAVLANRYSSTNVFGEIPADKISKGDILHLLAVGGLIGLCNQNDDYNPTCVEIVGFFSVDNKILNTVELQKKDNSTLFDLKNTNSNIFTVCGTSAEVGKTTLIGEIIRNIKEENPDKNIVTIKICGTGRMRDKNKYITAGSNEAYDFADFGLPSTYGLEEEQCIKLLNTVLNTVLNFEIVIFEIGGDLLEPSAQFFVEHLKVTSNKFFLVVNDAMGAITGMNIINSDIGVFSWKQNIPALRKRLAYENVFNFNQKNIKKYINQ